VKWLQHHGSIGTWQMRHAWQNNMHDDVQDLPNDPGWSTILVQLVPVAQHHGVCISVAQSCRRVHCAEAQWCV